VQGEKKIQGGRRINPTPEKDCGPRKDDRLDHQTGGGWINHQDVGETDRRRLGRKASTGQRELQESYGSPGGESGEKGKR